MADRLSRVHTKIHEPQSTRTDTTSDKNGPRTWLSFFLNCFSIADLKQKSESLTMYKNGTF